MRKVLIMRVLIMRGHSIWLSVSANNLNNNEKFSKFSRILFLEIILFSNFLENLDMVNLVITLADSCPVHIRSRLALRS